MFANEGDYMCQQCELDQYTTHLTVVTVDSEYVLILIKVEINCRLHGNVLLGNVIPWPSDIAVHVNMLIDRLEKTVLKSILHNMGPLNAILCK